MEKQKKESVEPNETTYETMNAAEHGNDIHGPFDTVPEMMEELKKIENQEYEDAQSDTSVDPFYSEEIMKRLKKSIAQMETGSEKFHTENQKNLKRQ